MSKRNIKFTIFILLIALVIPIAVYGQDAAGIQVTLLHTNDFHGRLQTDSSGRGGSAYMASKIKDIKSAIGEDNVLLMDAGDVYFAAPAISQLLMGESTIDIYNMLGYQLAVFGNHEFDKGQVELEKTRHAIRLSLAWGQRRLERYRMGFTQLGKPL